MVFGDTVLLEELVSVAGISVMSVVFVSIGSSDDDSPVVLGGSNDVAKKSSDSE